jgi:hypothetical protein
VGGARSHVNGSAHTITFRVRDASGNAATALESGASSKRRGAWMERCGSVPEGHLRIAQQFTAGDEATP